MLASAKSFRMPSVRSELVNEESIKVVGSSLLGFELPPRNA